MIKHQKYTPTRYEYAITDANGKRVFTLWFRQRRPSLNAIYNCVVANIDDIRKATNTHNIEWNGDGTITAGNCNGKMTGDTLLQARGYRQ